MIENGRDIVMDGNWIIYIRPDADEAPMLFEFDKMDEHGFMGVDVSHY